jgi:uncharacterized membrane protein YedE/YeeE
MRDQLPWWIGGPVLGLCVVAIRGLLNARLGVTGAVSEVVDQVQRRSFAFDWRGWFLFGLVAGGLVFALVRGEPGFEGYSWLTETFDSSAVIGLVLVVAGVLIGFGAKTAGGCTSGNGLTGTSMLSRAALVATATFFGTAIVVSFVIEALR